MFKYEIPIEPATETMSKVSDLFGEDGTMSDAKHSKTERNAVAWKYDFIVNKRPKDDRSKLYHSEVIPETESPPQEHMMSRWKKVEREERERNRERNTSA